MPETLTDNKSPNGGLEADLQNYLQEKPALEQIF